MLNQFHLNLCMIMELCTWPCLRLAFTLESEIHLTFNYILCYVNDINKNKAKSHLNMHIIKYKRGRVWASMFGWDSCAQLRCQPLNPPLPPTHTNFNNFDHDHHIIVAHYSPNSSVAWSVQVQTDVWPIYRYGIINQHQQWYQRTCPWVSKSEC